MIKKILINNNFLYKMNIYNIKMIKNLNQI